MSDKLTAVVAALKESFFNQFGRMPDMLLVPRQRGFVSEFAEGLHIATKGEAGSVPYIFHHLWVENSPCTFLELDIFVTDEVEELTPDINMTADDIAELTPSRIIH